MSKTKENKQRKIKLDTTSTIKTAYEVLIIDRSSSMSYQKDTTLEGINKYVNNLKTESTKHGINTQIMMIMFDSNVETLYPFTDIKEYVDLNANTYLPNGMTALNDAVMTGITAVQEAVKGREKDPDIDVTISIFTDGFENASKTYPNNQEGENIHLKGLIKELTDEYKWTIAYTGAGSAEQAIAQAQSLNIPIGNTLNYCAGAAGPSGASGALGSIGLSARSAKMDSFAKGLEKTSATYFTDVGAGSAMHMVAPTPDISNLATSIADAVIDSSSLIGDILATAASSTADVVSGVASAACDCAAGCCD